MTIFPGDVSILPTKLGKSASLVVPPCSNSMSPLSSNFILNPIEMVNTPQQPQAHVITTKNPASEYFKGAFFGAAGSFVFQMICVLIGLVFFIPGLLMAIKQARKKKEERSNGWLITGVVLMFIGLIIGIGPGALFIAGMFGVEMVQSSLNA